MFENEPKRKRIVHYNVMNQFAHGRVLTILQSTSFAPLPKHLWLALASGIAGDGFSTPRLRDANEICAGIKSKITNFRGVRAAAASGHLHGNGYGYMAYVALPSARWPFPGILTGFV